MQAPTENSSTYATICTILERRDLIAHAASRLRADLRDQFALNLLARFEEADAAFTERLTEPVMQALRESLRRVATQLLIYHTEGYAPSLSTELIVLEALVSSAPGSLPEPRKGPRRIIAAVIFALMGAGVLLLLPALREARSELANQKTKVEKLENRLAQVANEKAKAQDDKEYAAAAAEQLAEIAALAASITDDLELCISYGDEVTQVFIDISKGYTFNQLELDRFFDEWAEVCVRARADAESLRDYVSGK